MADIYMKIAQFISGRHRYDRSVNLRIEIYDLNDSPSGLDQYADWNQEKYADTLRELSTLYPNHIVYITDYPNQVGI